VMAGRLDTLITLLRPTRTRHPDGSWMQGWEEVARVWATVTPVSARERLGSPQVIPEETVRFHIRWMEALDPSWAIRHAGKTWQIDGIARYPRERRMEIMASAADAGQARSA